MKHLSSEQIDGLIIGVGELEERRHLEECYVCRRELVKMEEPLFSLRSALRHWSENQVIPELPLRRAPRPLRWALVAAVLALTAAIPVYRETLERGRQIEENEDELLFKRINSHLSRDVPASMESFMELVEGSVNSAAAEGGIQ